MRCQSFILLFIILRSYLRRVDEGGERVYLFPGLQRVVEHGGGAATTGGGGTHELHAAVAGDAGVIVGDLDGEAGGGVGAGPGGIEGLVRGGVGAGPWGIGGLLRSVVGARPTLQSKKK